MYITYWGAVDSLLDQVKSVCEEDITYDFNCILKDIEVKFQYLATLMPALKMDPMQLWEEIVCWQTAMMRPSSRIRNKLCHIENRYRNIAQIVRLHVSEQFKLQLRLTQISIKSPQSGNDIAFLQVT